MQDRIPFAHVAPLLLAMGLGCTGSDTTGNTHTALVDVRARALVTNVKVTRIRVTVTPANATFDLARTNDNAFSGLLHLPTGTQHLAATAYDADGQSVAMGEATAQIVVGQTTLVRLTLYDSSGVEPQPDHGPVLQWVVIPKNTVLVGETLLLSAAAIDPDGDSLQWQWSSTCSSERLLTPTASETVWLSDVVGQCSLSVTVTSNGLSDSESFQISVVAGGGAADVVVTYVVQPRIAAIRLGTSPECTVDRESTNATCEAAATPAQPLRGVIEIEPYLAQEEPTVRLSDNCGGSVLGGAPVLTEVPGVYAFEWTPPSTSGVLCMVVATVVRDDLLDRLAIAVSVALPTISQSFDLFSISIPAFRDGKRAAASYTFDDGPASSFRIAEIFERYGMRATFFIIPGFVAESAWAQWSGVVERGHEVGNHSMTHVDLSDSTLTDEQLLYQIEDAQRALEQKLGIRPQAFAFPYHRYNSRSATVALRTHLVSRTPGLPFGGPTYRVLNWNEQSTTLATNSVLEDIIVKGGWFVAAGHGIDGNGWSPITSQFLSEHLELAAAHHEELWVDTFWNVAAYSLARPLLQPQVIVRSPYSITIRLSGTLDARLAKVPLTIEVPLKRPPSAVYARTDDGREVPVVVTDRMLRLSLSSEQVVELELPSGI